MACVASTAVGRAFVTLAATAAVVGAVASCGADAPRVAEGADLERPSAPSMALVRFEDVAADVGLDFRHGAFRWGPNGDPAAMMGGGVCWVDYDRDGWLDLFAVNTWSDGEWGRWRREGALPSSRLFRNDAGRFVDVTAETGAGVETRGNGCVAADLDLDGWTDLYVTTDRENVLLWNDGGDGFVDDADLDVPTGAAVFGWHAGAAVGDVDGNGWPDLFVTGYVDINRRIPSAASGFPSTHEPEADLLLLNSGPASDGRRVDLREVAADVGIEPDGADYGLGAVLSDLDADGDLDLYVANDTTSNQLYENVPADTPDGFELVERGVESGVGDTGAGMGVASGDADGDGRLDLVVTNQLKELNGAFRQVSPLLFEDARSSMGLPELGAGSTGWGVAWSDLDLDTDLDLVTANGAIPVSDLVEDREAVQLFENRTADGRVGGFVDAGAIVGLDDLGSYLARGLAAADFDNDGDVDIALGTVGGDLALLRNSGAGGNWLLVAPPAPAPGAMVTVLFEDGRRLGRELHAGGSYLSSEDPRAHFGLGTATQVASVTVQWPDGSTTVVDDVEANRILQVEPTG